MKAHKRSNRLSPVVARRGLSGVGLFAQKAFKKGARIIEYVGRDVPEAEQYTSRSKYLFEINDTRTIDGNVKENIARYINHSCRPNCEPDVVRGRVFIYAKRNIAPGEELTYNYGKEYFTRIIAPKGCRCSKCVA